MTGEVPPPKKPRTAAQVAATKKAAAAAAARRREHGLSQAQLDGLAHGRVRRRQEAAAADRGTGEAYDPAATPPVPEGRSARRIVDTPYPETRPKRVEPADEPTGTAPEPVGTAPGPTTQPTAHGRSIVDVVLIALGVKEP